MTWCYSPCSCGHAQERHDGGIGACAGDYDDSLMPGARACTCRGYEKAVPGS